MKTKVVILNWNGRNHLERFLPSVVAHTPDATIVVADNGSTDDSIVLLRDRFPEVELLLLDQNYGYAEGYNRALRAIEGEYYVLLNSDVEVSAGWLEPLIALLERNPKAAAVAPKLRAYSTPERFEYAGAAGGFIDFLGYPFCRGRILNSIEVDCGQHDNAREIFWASGACMAIRAEAFHSQGGFDTDFFAHMEEIDLCWRLQSCGWSIWVEPAGTVYHLGGGTLPNNTPHKIYLNYRNNLMMLFKNLPSGRKGVILTARMILDGLSAGVFLLQGKPDFFSAVWRAHRDFRVHLPVLRTQRKAIQAARTAESRSIYRGSILLRYLFGRKTFDQMM